MIRIDRLNENKIETDKIDRDIDISYGSTAMEIFPMEEKTYVSY